MTCPECKGTGSVLLFTQQHPCRRCSDTQTERRRAVSALCGETTLPEHVPGAVVLIDDETLCAVNGLWLTIAELHARAGFRFEP